MIPTNRLQASGGLDQGLSWPHNPLSRACVTTGILLPPTGATGPPRGSRTISSVETAGRSGRRSPGSGKKPPGSGSPPHAPKWIPFLGTLLASGAIAGPLLDGIHSRTGLQVRGGAWVCAWELSLLVALLPGVFGDSVPVHSLEHTGCRSEEAPCLSDRR